MEKHWNSDEYTENFGFVSSYGMDLLNLLSVPKGSFTADFGCGNGFLTSKLKDAGYTVKGIDKSPEMIKKAKALHPEIEFEQGDICTYKLEKNADAIFSNAVFHWIDNHDALIENIALNLNRGGEFVFEFGGKGCAETVHSALKKSFETHNLVYRNNFNFKSIGEFAPILERHGFRVEYATLFNRPTVQKGENGLERWIDMFVDEPFRGVDSSTKNDIIKSAVDSCRPVLYKNGQWFVDYVRLRMKAVKI